jgi:hypothetical protein
MEIRFGDCQHPFKSCQAYAVEGGVPTPDGLVMFKIHFRCLKCGHEMIMISKGHAASPEERAKVVAKDGELRKDP